jgi:hypothetical protein
MLGDRSKQQPIAALAIATTCWPVATFTLCCIAPPVLATDAVIQWGKGTPIGMKVEQTAAEALEVCCNVNCFPTFSCRILQFTVQYIACLLLMRISVLPHS